MAPEEKEVGAPRDPRRALGNRGEDLAVRFFVDRGYDIATRNWRCRYGEIDLVVRKGEEIRIVEVKTRKSLRAGAPEESITDQKLQRLEDLAHCYFDEQGIHDPAYHIDVLSITIDPSGETRIEHLPDIG